MRDSAEDQLERVFYLLSAASLLGGVSYDELREATGTSREQAARDVVALADRVLYHPPGGTAGADILVDGERVRVLARGARHRPLRLSPREAAALALGLRAMALQMEPARGERLRALGRRLERFAARAPRAAATALTGGDASGPTGVYDVLHRGAAERRACRISYLKPGAPAVGAARVVHPYALVHAERWWYVLGPDPADGVLRFFRLDRVVDAALLEDRFTVPPGFDGAAHVAGGRAFAGGAEDEVVVRYRPAAARYVRERWPGAEAEPDGGCTIRHPAADPTWVVQHVLSYGPDAEVIAPPAARAQVARAAAELAARWAAPPAPRG